MTSLKELQGESGGPILKAEAQPDVKPIPFSEIEPREIQWLWPGLIALGRLSIISGNPGLGKSQASLSIAACVKRKQLFRVYV